MALLVGLKSKVNMRFVLQDAVKLTGYFALTGLVLGLLSGVSKEVSRKKDITGFREKLPRTLQQQPEFADCIINLSETKLADMEALERVARRCNSLIELAGKVHNADPASVEPSVSAAASQMQDSIGRYLQRYYLNSNVSLISEGTGINRVSVPLSRDLRHAHVALMGGIEGVVNDIHCTVKDKREEKAAAVRYGGLEGYP